MEGFQAQFRTVEAERDALHTQLLQTFNACNALAEKEAEVAASAAECARLQTHLDIATEMIGEQNSRVRSMRACLWDTMSIACALTVSVQHSACCPCQNFKEILMKMGPGVLQCSA